MLFGQCSTGGVESTMATVWVQIALMPHRSVALQARATNFGQLPLVIVLTTVMVTLVPDQSSNATGGVKLHAEPHCTPKSVQNSCGGVVSTTVTCRVQVFVLPQASNAPQVMVMTCGQTPLVVAPTK